MRRTTLLLASMAVVVLGLAGGAAFAVVTTASGGSIERVLIARETQQRTTSSNEFLSVPGAVQTVNVPGGTTRLIMARFSAESLCSGGTRTEYCMIRIVADPVAGGSEVLLQPDDGTVLGSVFDSTGTSWESHSMDKSGRLGTGVYNIRVLYKVTNLGGSSSRASFTLDDWSLTVEQSR